MKTKLTMLSLCLAAPLMAGAVDIESETGFPADVLYSARHLDSTGHTDEAGMQKGAGGITFSYYPIVATNFLGRQSTFQGETTTGLGDMYCSNGSPEKFVDHEIKLTAPDDLVDGFRIWGSDTSAGNDMRVVLYRQCLPAFGADSIFTEVFYNELITANGGEFSQFNVVEEAFEGLGNDTGECKLMARINYAVGACTGSDVNLYKLRIQIRSGDVIFQDNFNDY